MKRLLVFLMLLLSMFTMTSCDLFDSSGNDKNGGGTGIVIPGPEMKSFRVYFVVDGVQKYYMDVTNKQIFTPPAIPKKNNFETVGWVDSNGILQDFKSPFENSTTFYAKYSADYAAITNDISLNVMSANVKIEKTAYNKTLLGLIKTDIIGGTGSGIIFHDQHDNYYVLTNEHVTKKSNRKYVDFTIIDYKGNEYTAYLGDNYEQASYDLSVLYFKKKTEKLNVIKLATSNPAISEEIVAIGQPGGQNNTITFGKVTEYASNIKLSNGYAPSFSVIKHSAPIDRGSSGGALLNFDFKLVGLNFASGSQNDEWVYSLSIPIEKINEYLKKYVWT